MACPPVQTGERFLEAALAHVDCQAQTIGSYGYGALADPGSAVSVALTGLLTIFVALFGVRIALGLSVDRRDGVNDFIRVMIVLILATSWPAWRVVGYDLVINGPAEIVRTIGLSADLPGSSGDLASRLQRVDDAIAWLNERGSGRRGVANGDWFQLGFARSAFLTGTLGPIALVKLTAGILLALAPLVAGLLLFGVTRSIFAGWAKALVATFVATITLSLILATELALLEPWLAGVMRLRSANEAALGAPVEILIITLAFALISFGAVAFVARFVFASSVSFAPLIGQTSTRNEYRQERAQQAVASPVNPPGERARAVAWSVSESINRDARLDRGDRTVEIALAETGRAAPGHIVKSAPIIVPEALGSSYRRSSSRRVSAAGVRRDQTG